MTTRQRDHLELERMASDAASTPYDVAVERAVDVGLRRACYGALAFGVGVGVGSAYEEAQRAFASVK